MSMATQIKETCRRCGKPLINDHDEHYYCLIHGEQSPAPISEPIKPHGKKKPAAGSDQGTAGSQASGSSGAGDPPADPPVPPRPAARNRIAVYKYYEANKDQIIQAYVTFGFEAADKWHIAKSQFRKLLHRWNVLLIKSKKGALLTKTKLKPRKPPPVLPPPATVKRSRLPGLPDFNATWPIDMQSRWLQIYEKLVP